MKRMLQHLTVCYRLSFAVVTRHYAFCTSFPPSVPSPACGLLSSRVLLS